MKILVIILIEVNIVWMKQIGETRKGAEGVSKTRQVL